jgi:hypothetical protein
VQQRLDEGIAAALERGGDEEFAALLEVSTHLSQILLFVTPKNLWKVLRPP